MTKVDFYLLGADAGGWRAEFLVLVEKAKALQR